MVELNSEMERFCPVFGEYLGITEPIHMTHRLASLMFTPQPVPKFRVCPYQAKDPRSNLFKIVCTFFTLTSKHYEEL